MATAPPTGTVTMLFTDIEGSTRLARALGDAWPEVLAAHHDIVGGAIVAHGGHVDKIEGDAFFATFAEADAAVDAAAAAQRGLRKHVWPDGAEPVRVRMGQHTADVARFHGEYVGLEVHRAARVANAASGGQILLTGSTRAKLSTKPECDDLGIHRLKDFPEPTRLFHLVVEGARATDFPPPRTLDVRPTNLPAASVPLVGREREVAEVRRALGAGAARLVTLTGLGGAGKTTGAIEIGHSLLDEYRGGVWLVRAEALTEGHQLIASIAEAMWVKDNPGGDLSDALIERLIEAPTLLLLDNLEQVTDAGTSIAELLRRVPSVQILATSRAPLRLAGERVVALGPLPIDSAVTLLRQRAEAIGATDGSDWDGPSVRHLCQRLDCLPLAIELVAPRLRVLDAAQVLETLGPLSALTNALVDRPDRQQSVKSTVEWSVGLLTEPARRLFHRLAIFEGAAPVGVIDATCCWDLDVVDALGVLLDHSLVARAPTGFALVTSVREVAVEGLLALPDHDLVRRRHADAIATMAERASTLTQTREDKRVFAALLDDAWAATVWARRADPAMHRRLVRSLSIEWVLRGLQRRALDEVDIALASPDLAVVERGQLLAARAYVLVVAGRPTDAEATASEAVRLLHLGGDPADLGHALLRLSQANGATGAREGARLAALEALSCFRGVGDDLLVARALDEVSQAEAALGNIEAAGRALDEAERLVRTPSEVVASFFALARADLALAAGDLPRAVELYAITLDADCDYLGWSIAGLAVACAGLGHAAVALELGAVAEVIAAELGTGVDVLTQVGEGVPSAMRRCRSQLSPELSDTAAQRGKELPAGQRIPRALELIRQEVARDVR